MKSPRHVAYADYIFEVLPPREGGGSRTTTEQVRTYRRIVAGKEPAPHTARPPGRPRTLRAWGTLLRPRPLVRGIGRRRLGRVDWVGWAVLALLIVGAAASVAFALVWLCLLGWGAVQGWLWLLGWLR